MQLNEDQLQRYEALAKLVQYRIERKIDNNIDNLRLNYHIRKDFEEKKEFTAKQLKKTRKKIGVYQGDLAEFVRVAVLEEHFFYDGFENERLSFVNNFVTMVVDIEDLEKINEDYLDEFEGDYVKALEESVYDYSIIDEFIEGIALASLHNNLMLFYEEDKEPSGKKEDILPSNKSLLFNGKKMNLTERIRVANEVLDFEGQIRKLNILDSEKYQLMAYILGNDVSNVRNVINGTRPNKIREKEINAYLKDLMK